jgi:class 3 adenylate cyclase/tetratricopeptide (TPR) repeat protein
MRKLAAIMFTDIVGYSALMSENESSALRVLDTTREIIKEALLQFNGEFVKEIGDGTLSIFQSSWDAVSCAIEIQRALSKESHAQLRIGIHIGDIVFSENDIFGDGVNIAARIQMACDPGSIFISEKVYDDIRNKQGISARFMGEKHLKNIGQPVKIYAIIDDAAMPAGQLITSRENTLPAPQKSIRINLKQAVIAISIIILLAAGAYLLKTYLPGSGEVAEPIPIAVISFENQTGDESLDYLQKAIPNLIITNLEQSGLFQTIPWERMEDVMDQLGSKDAHYINASMGFEICRKVGYPFIVTGSFVKAGEVFVTDVKVLDVETKQIITSVSTKGMGLSSILENQVDDLSKSISRSVGISSRKLSIASMRILDVTTSSISAYKYFLQGREDFDKMYFNDARQALEKAVEIDPGFAIAHLYLSHTYNSLSQNQKQIEELEKAYRTSVRATEIEKLTIRAAYSGIILNDPQQELQLLLLLAEKAPDHKRVFYSLGLWYRDNGNNDESIKYFLKALDLDPEYGEAINQLAYRYFIKGDFPQALEYLKKYTALNPGDANPFDSMGDLYSRMGDYDEALVNFKRALELKPDFYFSAMKIAYVYAIKEDYPQVNAWMEKALQSAPSVNLKAVVYWSKAFFDAFYGKRDESMKVLDKMVASVEKDSEDQFKMGYYWLNAWISYDHGDYAKSREQISAYLSYALQDPAYTSFNDSSAFFFAEGLCNVRMNRLDSAAYYAEQIRALSTDIALDFNYNFLEWEINIAGAKSTARLDSLASGVSVPYPNFAFPDILIYNVPVMKNSLAQAFERYGMKDKAIAEYERFISMSTANAGYYLVSPRYHYYLGILYQEKGLKEKAAEQYRTFLNLWKDADPVFKEPGDARRRLETLMAR